MEKNNKQGDHINTESYKKLSVALKCLLYILDIFFIIIIPVSFVALFLVDNDKSQKIVDFLKSVSIPLVSIIFILTFKNNLAKFIDELKHLKIFGNEATRETATANQEGNPDVDKISEKMGGNIDESMLTDEGDELKKTKLYLEYERIYNIIFGSQIELLDILKMNKSGLNMNFLGIYFHSVQNKFVNSLGGWTLFGYLRFLETNELIQFNNLSSTYFITEKGKDFLSYIELLKYSKTKAL